MSILLAIVSLHLLSANSAAVSPGVDHNDVFAVARAFFPQSNAQVVIEKSNRFGRWALVPYRQGRIEGSVNDGQLLLKHFDFGWQVVDLARPGGPGFSPSTLRKLAACASDCDEDVGSLPDIEAVRRNLFDMPNEAIGPVKIYGRFAMVEWWGNGGGEAVLENRNSRWHLLSGGAGCWKADDLASFHMAKATARKFIRWFPCGR